MSAGILEEFARSSGAMLAPITVQQYQAMLQARILEEGEPIELIDGLLVQKDRRDSRNPTITAGPLHSVAVTKLSQALSAALAGQPLHIRLQLPVNLSGIDRPEPDLAVIRGTIDGFRSSHPGPADLLLVAEVADSSLNYDRTTKQRLYAIAGIPLYWIVDLTTNRIEVFERPNPQLERYEATVHYGIDDGLPFRLGDREFLLPVREIF